jgi:hypothetical protein
MDGRIVERPMARRQGRHNGVRTKTPRFYFVVHAPNYTRDDPNGIVLAGPKTAREYGHQVIRELKDSGHDALGAVSQVVDENGRTIHKISF